MSEGRICSTLVKVLRGELPKYVVYKHADRVTAGIPDISATGDGMTTWMEVKYRVKRTPLECGQQMLMAVRLEREGSCIYAIFERLGQRKRTLIVSPAQLWAVRGQVDEVRPLAEAEGWSYLMVAHYIQAMRRR